MRDSELRRIFSETTAAPASVRSESEKTLGAIEAHPQQQPKRTRRDHESGSRPMRRQIAVAASCVAAAVCLIAGIATVSTSSVSPQEERQQTGTVALSKAQFQAELDELSERIALLPEGEALYDSAAPSDGAAASSSDESTLHEELEKTLRRYRDEAKKADEDADFSALEEELHAELSKICEQHGQDPGELGL